MQSLTVWKRVSSDVSVPTDLRSNGLALSCDASHVIVIGGSVGVRSRTRSYAQNDTESTVNGTRASIETFGGVG